MVKPRTEFVGLLSNASHVAERVAAELRRRGYRIRVLPHSVSPNSDDRWQHTDDGDLEITQRIELKHWPLLDFKSLDEVPYPNVIVDEAYKIERTHKSTLFAYMILNASVSGYLLVPVWTRRHWFKKKARDGREGDERTFYFCAKEHLSFHRLK